MGKGPNPKKLERETRLKNRERFRDEALRKRIELERRSSGGRPITVMKSSVDPTAIGTTLIVGKG